MADFVFSSVCLATIIIVYIGAYFYDYRSTETIPAFQSWPLTFRKDKKLGPDTIHVVEQSISVEKESRFSPSWWTDEKTFQLERRAIFSRVCHIYFSLLHQC